MPVKKVRGGWKAGSYVTKGMWLTPVYKTRAAAERRAKTSKRRSKRVRHTRRKY